MSSERRHSRKLCNFMVSSTSIGFSVVRDEPLRCRGDCIEPSSSAVCRKRRLMETSRGLPAVAIPSVVKV